MVPLADGSTPDPAYLIAQQGTPKPGAPAAAPAVPGKELVAVLDLEAVGASKVEASAMTDRLREELLKTGRFTIVDRSQMQSVLDEQALQQTGCTSQECAVQVGKVLGVKKIISGKVTKIAETQWLLAAQMVDVETSETVKAESLRHEGSYFSMLDKGIVELAAKLSAPLPGQKADMAQFLAAQQAAQPQAAPKPEEKKEESKGISKWWWVAGGVAVVGIAAALGNMGDVGSKGGGGGGSGCASCGKVSVTW